MPAAPPNNAVCVTSCAGTWKPKVLPSTNTNGGISIIATGNRMRSRRCASRRSGRTRDGDARPQMIAHIAIVVRDYAETIDFYTRALCFKFGWAHQFASGARSRPNTVSSSTFAPFSMSPGRENSLGEWLIPPTLGMKIMPIGPRLAISCASCAAPLGMAIAPLKVRRKRQDEPPALLGQHRLQARHVEPAGVGQVKAIKPDSPRMRPQGPMITNARFEGRERRQIGAVVCRRDTRRKAIPLQGRRPPTPSGRRVIHIGRQCQRHRPEWCVSGRPRLGDHPVNPRLQEHATDQHCEPAVVERQRSLEAAVLNAAKQRVDIVSVDVEVRLVDVESPEDKLQACGRGPADSAIDLPGPHRRRWLVTVFR